MKQLSALLLLVLLPGASVLAAPLGEDLPGLLEYAREHNPGLAAARLEAEAAAQRSSAADALPDPVLRTELMDFTNRGSNRPASLWPSQVGATRYLLMQSVPWFGRRDLQRDVALAQQERASGQVAASWAELEIKLKSSYAQYYYLSGSERLASQTLDLMSNLEKVAQTRYANGLGVQQDVIRAQLAQTDLRSELLDLENMTHHMHGRINALLSRPNMAELAEPLQLRAMPPAARLDWATLEAKLRARNPQLLIAEAGVNEAEKRRALAYNNRYPGFTLGIAPTQSGSQVKSWDLMVEFNIPLQQDARRAQEGEAEAMLAASNARKTALQDEMLAALSETVAGLETARRTETLLATRLLPQAELSYQSALTGYETGKVDFTTLLDAERQILNARRQLLKAQLEVQLRLAELESLIGEEL
ncbi:MAG: TolC family protein [Gallionella sp.]|nr:TolC family protein [Gallionella sp.]MDD4946513.1 TolC family protein [Gallionella sp.]MDD5613229.1 TolC family protein [Gallionella sp.]